MTFDSFFEERAPVARVPRSEGTWARVRDDYLAGVAATELCARHGVALSTLRHRAKQEGWRRSDQPDPVAAAPVDLLEEPAEGEPVSAKELEALALRRAGAAVRRGLLREASGWSHVARQMRLHHEAGDPSAEAQARASKALRDAQAAVDRLLPPAPLDEWHEWHESDAVSGVQWEAASPAPADARDRGPRARTLP